MTFTYFALRRAAAVLALGLICLPLAGRGEGTTTANPAAVHVPAFPGAEGGGMYTTGGRGGKVLCVTRLEDDDQPGSLRWALTRKYPRIVVFSVSGVIQLQKRITISSGDLTVAGQTAPGDGICVCDYPVVIRGADNVILRYLRFRLGDETKTEDDALGGQWNSNVIVDHCSTSWSTDECASFYGNVNFTMQWCILHESLRKSVHSKGGHGFGGIWGGKDASFHHNLLACHDSRNPRLDHSFLYLGEHTEEKYRGAVDVRNNVIYNWGNNNTYGGEGGQFNLVGNYYKPGPASKPRNYFLDAWGSYQDMKGDKEWHDVGYPKLYIEGNFYEGNPGGINADNRKGVHYNPTREGSKEGAELSAPLPILGRTDHTTTHTAWQAFESVATYAGCCTVRDAVDLRAVTDARSGKVTIKDGGNGSTNGLIDTQAAVGGWPEYRSLPAPADTDGDGMPDEWERARGLDPNDPSDGAKCTLDPNYTNVEVYLNSLVEHITSKQNFESLQH